jgi:hypothetical protein
MGWFSCAMNCTQSYSLTRRAIKLGKPMKVFLEVNKNAPRVYGHNHFHISEVTAVNEADWDLISLPRAEITQEDVAIASYIAEYIPDGACVQLGIGGLPDAVGKQLTSKKDLGCHTEMIVDAYLDLYKSGALTNRKKTFMEDKMVGSIIIGQPELYKFVDQNPGIECMVLIFVLILPILPNTIISWPSMPLPNAIWVVSAYRNPWESYLFPGWADRLILSREPGNPKEAKHSWRYTQLILTRRVNSIPKYHRW